jgi:3-deoxy-D-manno-octulosonic-acid transferase
MTRQSSPSLLLYRLLLWSAAPVAAPLMVLGARLRGKARPPLRARLRPRLDGVRGDGVWIQAVSVGEVEVARRITRELRQRAPELPLLVTSTTATGLELARTSVGDSAVVHPCPVDLPGSLARVFDAARPRLLVLVETELWPEMLHQAGRRAVPVAVVNARLSEASFARYRRVRGLLRPLLGPLSRVLARSPADGERFAELGVPERCIEVVGNIKYDLEPSPAPLPWADRVERWAAGRPVLVAGSTMDGEEPLVVDAVDAVGGAKRVFLVLAPRHPERAEAVAQLLAARGLGVVRRSRLETMPEAVDVLLIDTIGELGRAYRLGAAAFIGGSLVATGGHNPLEPAAWSVPVLSGPHVHNFEEVYDQLVAGGGAVIVDDAAALAATFGGWLDDPGSARAVGHAAQAILERNRGATERTVSALLALVG